MRNNLHISTLPCMGRIKGSCTYSMDNIVFIFQAEAEEGRARLLEFEICALWRTDGRPVRLYLMAIGWNKVEDLRNF